MTIDDIIIKITKLASEHGDVNLSELVSSLRSAMSRQLEVKEKLITELRKRLAVFEQEQLATKRTMVCIKGVYYARDDKGNPMLNEPYCQKCYLTKKIPSMLHIRSDGLYGSYDVCGSVIPLREEPLPRPEDDKPYDPFRGRGARAL